MRKIRSKVEIEKVTEHLEYELYMLSSITRKIGSGEIKDEVISNALLESFTIHARALLDFFYNDTSKGKADDVIAEDFFYSDNEWLELRPEKTKLLIEIHKRVGKEVAHLTYARLQVSIDNREWHFLEINNDIFSVFKVFEENAPRNLIHIV